jgi:hypothetical protein
MGRDFHRSWRRLLDFVTFCGFEEGGESESWLGFDFGGFCRSGGGVWAWRGDGCYVVVEGGGSCWWEGRGEGGVVWLGRETLIGF